MVFGNIKIIYLVLCRMQIQMNFHENHSLEQLYRQNRYCSFLLCNCSLFLRKPDFSSICLGSPIANLQWVPSHFHIQSDTTYYLVPLAKLLHMIKYWINIYDNYYNISWHTHIHIVLRIYFTWSRCSCCWCSSCCCSCILKDIYFLNNWFNQKFLNLFYYDKF